MNFRQVSAVGLLVLAGVSGTLPGLASAAGSGADHPVVGTYDVVGTNAMDNSPYSGWVKVTEQGDTLSVQFRIEGVLEPGIGIFDDDVLVVSWIYNKKPTVLLMYPTRNGGWSGHWAYNQDTRLGTETWTPR